MKKRILSVMLCFIMMFAGLPLAPLDIGGAITASAEGVDVSELRQLYESVPKDQWDKYIDTSILENWYAEAEKILQSPDSFEQSYIDLTANSLNIAISNLELHTQEIKLDKTSVMADVGSTVALRAILNPENAADPIEWKSSNESVASVNSDGTVSVKAYSKNPVTITASSNGHHAECKITVLNPLAGVRLSKTSHTLFETQSFNLTASTYGKDSSAATTDTVIYTWDSSNSDVASVSDSGKVTARKKGTTTITVYAKADGNIYKASCAVTVNKLIAITGLKVSTDLTAGSLPMTVNESTVFKVTVSPADASIKSFKWSSSNPSVATVMAGTISGAVVSANIKALKTGTTKISYATTDGSNRSGSFTVEVKPLISYLSISPSIKVISTEDKGQKIKATIKPTNAGNQVLTWTSSNTNICDVNYEGVLIPKSNGKVTISAKTKDGTNLTASCTVRVADKASSVSLSKTTQTINVGKTATLSATVKTVTGGSYGEVSWSSSNTKVATVSSKGVVTAVYPGQAKITATTLDGTKKTATCVVTVKAPVTGVSLSAKATVNLNDQLTLKPKFTPSYATNKKVTWKTSNKAVATVSSNGVVTGKKIGKATITCTTADGGYKANCVVSVVIMTTSVKLSKSSATIAAGKTLTLKATVAPSNATNKTVTWSTSNKKVATVSSSGVITAVAGGKCTITAKSSGGQTATCTVTVTQKVSGLSINRTSMTLYQGQVYKLSATVTPSTATNKTVSWYSSNTKAAKVSSSGSVTAVSPGTAIITVKTADGGYTENCTVKVVKKVDVKGISLSSKTLAIDKGKQATLDVTFNPNNASERGITWTTSDKSIATVSSTGVVKGIKTGKAVITAKSKDGGFTAKCTVSVGQKVTGIKLSASSLSVAIDSSKTIKATVSPSDASNKKVSWKSSNTAIAKVSSNGVVTGVKSGNVTITATTADGGYTASCSVKVYIGVSSITLNKSVLKIPKGETGLLKATVSPSNAAIKTVKWSSSDKSVATVTSAGQINSLKTGATIITARTVDGGYTAECMVEIVQLASAISINYNSVTLQAGSSKTLTATITPSTASNKTVKWSSSNKKVATVNSKGKVKAVGAGTATITAKSGDGMVKATCKITVRQPITSIKLNKTSTSIDVGKTKKLTATIGPKNATDKTIKWSSSDTSVATVNSSGVVKAVKKGTATITVSSSNGKVTASCKVKVITPVKSVKLNKTSASLKKNKTVTLAATVNPSNATNKKVSWTSSNTKVAVVDKNGKVTAKAPGSAVITVKTANKGFTATCKVTVIQPLKGISFANKTVTADLGKKTKLSVVYSPKNATNKKLKWTSSNKSVAKVSSDGTLTPLKLGTVTITAKSKDGGFTAKCTVKIVRKVSSVKLNKTSLVLYLGKTATLKHTLAPSNATNKKVSWKSSNANIVKVSSSGKLTPVKVGTATVTVKTADGGKTAKCTVKVEKAVKSVSISKASLNLFVSGSYTLKASVAPSDATNKKLTWTSSNTSVAAVNASGTVKALKSGTAVISVKSSNGIIKKCTVKVTQPVTAVSLNKAECTVYTDGNLTLKASVLPNTATNKGVTWSSSDPTVASVSSAGVVSGVKAGTTVITVKTNDGGKTAKCTVTVLQHAVQVQLNEVSLKLMYGETATLSAQVLPDDASDKSIEWKSSDSEIASVSNDGTVTANGSGTAVITAVAENGVKAECTVTVIKPVTGIMISESSKSVFSGISFALFAQIAPSDASNQKVNWTSSDESCASVDSDGTVTALKAGTATITASSEDGGFTASCVVTVLQNAEKIILSETKLRLNVGEQKALTASVLPENAENTEVIWSVSDSNVASVSSDGVVTAKKSGTAIIKAVSLINPSVFCECIIEVS